MVMLIDNKTRIREKSRELFMQLGIRSVSMDDIANAIGMSKKTLYHYYTDKETLVADTIEMVLKISSSNCEYCRQKAHNAIHEGFLASDFVEEMMKSMNPALLFDMQKYYPAAYRKFLKFKEESLYNFICQNIEWGVRDGLFRDDINIHLVSRLRIEGINLPFQRKIYEEIKTDPGALQKEILILFLHAIATTKGTRMINKYKTEKLKPLIDDTK
ncbi:TetR/AcrR family transcriptional regulator [Niabella aquatica]